LNGTQSLEYSRFVDGRWERVRGMSPTETPLRIHINGRHWVTMMCSPVELDVLVIGFLRSEGVIQDVDDVRLVTVCPSGTCVDVWLRQADVELPQGLTITSGCGGGVAFGDLVGAVQPLPDGLRVTPSQLCELMTELQKEGKLYREARGLHTSGLAAPDRLLAVAEDVGRHNTIDRLWGRCLMARIPTRERILLSTGRISSEMLRKAARMGAPVVASRTAPTSLSVELAQKWNITLVGYVRRNSFNLYAGQQRIVDTWGGAQNANS